MDEKEKILKPSPWDTGGLWTKLSFSWIISLFRKGYHKDLTYDDLCRCPKSNVAQSVFTKLERQWEKQLHNARPSLFKAMVRTFGPQWIVLQLLTIYEDCFLRIVQPLFLGVAIRFFSGNTELNQTWAYTCAGLVCLCSALCLTGLHPHVILCQVMAMKMRVATISLIYKKLLKLSHGAKSQATVGHIINLVSNDVSRFDEVVIFGAYCIVGPLQVVVGITILWSYIGVSSLIGVLILVLFLPLQGVMGKLFSAVRRKTAGLTDERIRLMSEIVGGMRVIKMYAWERPFSEMVEKVRRKEVGSIRRACMLKAINLSLYFVASRIVVFACLVHFVLRGKQLTAETVFVTLSMFETLRHGVAFLFPQAISTGAEALVSCKRIQKLLLLPEKVSTNKATVENVQKHPNQTGRIVVDNLSAWWSLDSAEPCLRSISTKVTPGKILAVVGPVGGGKSSLLMTFLEEMARVTGYLSINGRIAYVSQEAWTFNDSVKNNILFGRPYVEDRYKKVVQVTALTTDFKLFEFGDKTMVGEGGLSLSGGQKARVSLARALYEDADIYLLDDPLSAVDASVASHIFNKCIMEYLGSKTRVLVTHQLQFLEAVDEILVLRGGECIACGTYSEITKSGLDFMSLVQEESTTADEKDHSISGRHRTISTQSSTLSSTSIEVEYTTNTAIGPCVEDESKASGSVRAGVYWGYIRSGAGVLFVIVALCAAVSSQTFYHASDFWLTHWTNHEDQKFSARNTVDTNNRTATSNSSHAVDCTNCTTSDDQTRFNLIVYSSLVGALFCSTLLRSSTFFIMCMRASVNLHNKIFFKILRSPMLLFDTSPAGRILNRFSRDLGIVDELLPGTGFDLNMVFFSAIGVITVISIINVYLMIPAFLLCFIVVWLRGFYIKTAREVKRLEGLARSPIYSHFHNTFSGLTSIRAFKTEERFNEQLFRYVDDHSATWFTFICSSRTLGLYLDYLCVFYISIVTVVLVVFPEGMPGGNAGLALSSALMLTGMFQWGVRQSAEFESQMTSVERILEYTELETEAELESDKDKRPSSNWPTRGCIEFRSVSLKYSPDSRNVLNDISCVIEDGEKVGVVGRTGAGKSSLLTCLFRISEPSGEIIIDNVNIRNIGLHDLRKKISIIPQNPVLFAGTVRSNIDPFNERSDEDLWRALEAVQLKSHILELNNALDADLSTGGGNFSVGQRQLICLARALLRNNRILAIDEATANVDHKTDYLIQKTIRENFSHCTVLTIAHRLDTIIDCDRVMVMDAGRLVEFDNPFILLSNEASAFYKLVRHTGSANYERLLKKASECYSRQCAQVI